MPSLDTPISNIARLTPRQAKALAKLGLGNVRDMLLHFPSRHDDFSRIVIASPEFLGQVITIEGTVRKVSRRRIFPRRLTITEALVEDASGQTVRAAWFNQALALSGLKEGLRIRMAGKLSIEQRKLSLNGPSFERAERDATNTGRLVPVYPETDGITSKWIRWQLKGLLPLADRLPDIVPDEIRRKLHLFRYGQAIRQIHFPDSQEKISLARKTFAFREMFLMQLRAIRSRMEWEGKSALKLETDLDFLAEFRRELPFELTGAQEKAIREILDDLAKGRPMNRLLNGDVGSGKTVVAAAAAAAAVRNGFQAALMAPTEVLARQHFESFCRLFRERNVSIALLTNSFKLLSTDGNGPEILKRSELLGKIAGNEIGIVIGTHALIQKDVRFGALALAVIDEQHRFGVAQRSALQEETAGLQDGCEKTVPHLLTMTATPIPRTLAIAFFGSLDLSILDELPKNRQPIETRIVPPESQAETYSFIRREIAAGRQAFIVFPFVEESKALTEVKAATVEYERLAERIFPDLRLGLLHGKMSAKEKEEAMRNFKAQDLDILIATSVVEVGIDVPNATVIAIENAERFGLSQLHQFRGRVGRGTRKSYCFLFTEETETERLRVLESTADGFRIAESDLELRGPGQFFGTAQSGLPDIAMENLGNLKLVRIAQDEAAALLKDDPELKRHPLIGNALAEFRDKAHLE